VHYPPNCPFPSALRPLRISSWRSSVCFSCLSSMKSGYICTKPKVEMCLRQVPSDGRAGGDQPFTGRMGACDDGARYFEKAVAYLAKARSEAYLYSTSQAHLGRSGYSAMFSA
jgi:hypothetical protein